MASPAPIRRLVDQAESFDCANPNQTHLRANRFIVSNCCKKATCFACFKETCPLLEDQVKILKCCSNQVENREFQIINVSSQPEGPPFLFSILFQKISDQHLSNVRSFPLFFNV